jgi:hypothetical protein
LTYPDGSKGIIEIKTGRAFDEPPLNYVTQVLWYMFVTGLRKGKLVGLFFGSDLREWDIEWDENLFSLIFDSALRWRESVLSDVQPDWDGSASTFETVKELNPLLSDSNVELGDLGLRLADAQAQFDVCNETVTALKSEALSVMADAKFGLLHGEVLLQRSLRNGKPVLTVKKGK